MNNVLKFTSRIFGGVAIGSLISSQVFAGTCQTEIRNFPAGTENITLACKKNVNGPRTAGIATAQTVGGVKSLVANLLQGQSVSSAGLNAAGAVIAGCTATDNVAGGATVTVNCAAAVKWRGSIQFVG